MLRLVTLNVFFTTREGAQASQVLLAPSGTAMTSVYRLIGSAVRLVKSGVLLYATVAAATASALSSDNGAKLAPLARPRKRAGIGP